jgi:hypothetical protein
VVVEMSAAAAGGNGGENGSGSGVGSQHDQIKRTECPQREGRKEGRKEGRRSGAFNLPRVFEM